MHPMPRRLVVLLDGTWNHPDQQDRGKTKPSNVTKLARAVKPIAADGRSQLTYYDDGVGTSWGLDKLVGGGFGVGLARNVCEAYRFLVYNYVPGDEIYVFGFSRGAYTARSLAGFVDRIGVLAKKDAFYLQRAFKLYERRAERAEFADFLADKTSMRVRIDFIGVWDTVGSIGLPTRLFHTLTCHRWNYHDVSLVASIRHAAHALAIDERRKPFRPTLWTDPIRPDQTLEQRWFAGVHSNIGGGYQKDGLANCALHWLSGRARAAGLDLDLDFLKPYKPFWGHELRESYRGFYRLLGPAPRVIGACANHSETIDDSVYLRYCDPDQRLAELGEAHPYRPANLEAYAREQGIDLAAKCAQLKQRKVPSALPPQFTSGSGAPATADGERT